MYSFLIRSAIRPEEAYQWFTYRGKKPVGVSFRGKDVSIKDGMRFGVRPSSNGKFIRLVLPDEITKVITVDLNTAKQLAKGVGRD